MTVAEVNNPIQSINERIFNDDIHLSIERESMVSDEAGTNNPCRSLKIGVILLLRRQVEVSLKRYCLCRWECEHQGTLYVYSGFDRVDGGLHVCISMLGREADGHVPQ